MIGRSLICHNNSKTTDTQLNDNDCIPFEVQSILVKGITVVAPEKKIGFAAFEELIKINTEWVAFVPYGFAKKGGTDIRYNLEWQWWGERLEGIESCIKTAKSKQLKVMLKPQIYIGGGWIGDMDFTSEQEWKTWESNYTTFVMDYVKIAAKYDVDLLCIGTEMNISVTKRAAYWDNLIQEVRKIYKGKITYSANWDHYQKIPFWGKLDYIGLSSYFPLSDSKTPTIEELSKAWQPVIKNLKNISEKNNKRILFTEYGYMSVDGCAGKAWEIEKVVHNLSINQLAQANAYEALWTNMSKQTFWAGGFLWKWFPDGMGHEGYPEKDYTPQNKKSLEVISRWFKNPKT